MNQYIVRRKVEAQFIYFREPTTFEKYLTEGGKLEPGMCFHLSSTLTSDAEDEVFYIGNGTETDRPKCYSNSTEGWLYATLNAKTRHDLYIRYIELPINKTLIRYYD